MLRDLKVFLGEHIRIPVISADELQKKYFLGGNQLISFLSLFSWSSEFIGVCLPTRRLSCFFLQQYKGSKFLAVIAVGLLAPVFAYLYGTIAHVILKLIKLD